MEARCQSERVDGAVPFSREAPAVCVDPVAGSVGMVAVGASEVIFGVDAQTSAVGTEVMVEIQAEPGVVVAPVDFFGIGNESAPVDLAGIADPCRQACAPVVD